MRPALLYSCLLVASVAVVSASCGNSGNRSFGGDGGGADGGPGFGDDSGFGDDGSHGMPTMPIAIDDCPGQIPASTYATLKQGGPIDLAMKWLYPYDATVFPGGILAPVLQWAPQAGGADAVLVHLHSQLFDYLGCFGPNTNMQLAVPDKVWTTAWAQSTGAQDPLKVELTTVAKATASGPITENWTFALGSLKGAIFYNTYTSPQVNNNGAVMKILPGASKPTPLLAIAGTSPIGPCISCHSLSSDGTMLVAQRHMYPPGLLQSESYDLAMTPTPNPASPLASIKNDDWGFSAVFPDGSRILTDGSPNQTGGIFPAAPGNNPGMEGPLASRMYDPKTGMPITVSGLPLHVMMPMFSPDGTKLVFNDYDNGQGHSLAVMDFDKGSNGFSNRKVLYSDPNLFPGWPFFTPDGASVVFVAGDSSNFASLYSPPSSPVAKGDLTIVDVANPSARPLDAANGFHAGQTYLPYPGRDEHLSFYPTVSPVAAGGYFWVFFTSRRNYGNTLVGAADDPKSKKLWAAAISIGASGGDTSHPAFYIAGQELASGNIRAFATLEPCKQNGLSCSTGIDCCCGSCSGGQCGCPMGCSKVDEKCTTSADCCDSSLQCINGFCATVVK
jgi:hypothetical protein